MATFCDGIVQNIERTECIGNSLVKINSNFSGIEAAGCELATYISDLQTTVASLSSSLAAAIGQIGSVGSVPVGAVSYFIGSTAPVGWLAADGSAILIATYSNLSNMLYVGNVLNPTASFGYKCTSNTNPTATRDTAGTYITLPDLRGYFLRGLGTNADGTASVGYGLIQADAFGSHTHTGSTAGAGGHNHTYNNTISNYTIRQGTGGDWPNVRGTLDSNGQTSSVGNHSHTLSIDSAGGTETRPKNIPLLPCIKF